VVPEGKVVSVTVVIVGVAIFIGCVVVILGKVKLVFEEEE
jgi:hypothetical protein